MLFNSYLFIFCFLPIVWAIFHILKALSVKKDSTAYMTLAKGFLVIASLFFYAYWKLIYLPILLGSIVVNYFLAKGIVGSSTKQIVDSNGGGKLERVSFLLKKPAAASPCTASLVLAKNGDSKIVEKNAENVFGSQRVGGGIFDEKAGLCSGEQGDKTCGLSPQGDTNSLLYRKKPTPEPSQAKTLLTLGIIFNLCLLGIFKYTDFFLENFNLFTQLLALDFTIPLPHILLPLALSFVTFQQIAFLVDCYKQSKEREETKRLESNIESNRESQKSILDSSKAKSPNEIPHINFLDYCLFITFFPQLIAGPIVHHKEMMPQFYAMSKGDSALGEQCDSVAQLSSRALREQSVAIHKSTQIDCSAKIDCHAHQAARNDKNLSKPAKDSRIFTQEVQNVAKSQTEAKVESSLHKA